MTVKRYPNWKVAAATGMPPIKTNQRAELDCGCKVLVGTRMDDGAAATACWACGDAHQPIMDTFQRLMVASLEEPADPYRRLVEVADELLAQAAEDHR